MDLALSLIGHIYGSKAIFELKGGLKNWKKVDLNRKSKYPLFIKAKFNGSLREGGLKLTGKN